MLLLLPTDFITGFFVGTILLNLVFYVAWHSGMFNNEKQLSWVLTTTSCILLTACATPYFIPIFLGGLDISIIIQSDPFSLGLLGFFVSYLFYDLLLGILYYQSSITLVNGYIHHTLYVAIAIFLAINGAAGIFCMFFYNEIPTIILALGSIRKEWRSDIWFVVVFFVTRIVLHVALGCKFYLYSEQRFVWKIILVVFPMHMYWFYGMLSQYVKNKRAGGL
ncbi:hypothetical protein BX661DRAFT_145489 [Kickxella alabastrina]|uniref:uncharacterized protein n=1 Tax=Kickxella alabastrina TaxID=61397 RepID=UPI0022202A56|nr:uncharacterized protein BX661DRAFT_145489 [Kickxella alabastrina]KAI7823496.1 hypothetical protein BX661DRAFT_145489 [Kickxella alabastrina]